MISPSTNIKQKHAHANIKYRIFVKNVASQLFVYSVERKTWVLHTNNKETKSACLHDKQSEKQKGKNEGNRDFFILYFRH